MSPNLSQNDLNVTPVSAADDVRTVVINQVAWGAIFAGAAIALAVQLLLNLLSLGVGMATVDPGTGNTPSAKTISIAAGLWFVFSGIFAAYLGGYLAGRLSGKPSGSTAGYHGLATWAVTTLLLFYLLTTAVGSLAGSALSAVGSAAGGLRGLAKTGAQTIAPAIASGANPFSRIEDELRQAAPGNDPAALRDAAVSAMRAALTGDQARVQDARARAAQAIARFQNISDDEARARVAAYEAQYQQALASARQQATEAADAAAKATSRAALYGFFALVLGALAAWFGGRAGTVAPTVTPSRFY